MRTPSDEADLRLRSADRKIDVVVNETAHLHRKRPALADRMRRIAGARAAVHATSSVAELAETAERLAARGSDVVFLSGGDGSFMAGVTALTRLRRGAPPGDRPLAERHRCDRRPKLGHARRPGRAPRRRTRRRDHDDDPADPPRPRDPCWGRGVARRLHLRHRPRRALLRALLPRRRARQRSGGAARRADLLRVLFRGPARAESPHPAPLRALGDRRKARAVRLVAPLRVGGQGPRHPYARHLPRRRGSRPRSPRRERAPPRQLGPRAPRVLAGKTIGGADHFDDLVQRFTVTFRHPEPTNGAAGAEHEGPYVLDGDILRASAVEVLPGPPLRAVNPPRR